MPGLHELVVGHFPRHSDAYYRWRIASGESRPLDTWSTEDFDNVAVAHDKLQAHEDAIKLMREKSERFTDDRLYETYANWGTFLIHAGRFKEGLEKVEDAIRINPDAHFGREVYQKRLVEYVLLRMRSKKEEIVSLPLSNDPIDSFHSFLMRYEPAASSEADGKDRKLQALREEAIRGITGMMRFGNAASPILLETLGDLLSPHHDVPDLTHRRLAARCYLRASMLAEGLRTRRLYREKAETVAAGIEDDSILSTIEARLADELQQADRLTQAIAEKEAAWIKSDADVDAEFQASFLTDPPLTLVGTRPWIQDHREVKDRPRLTIWVMTSFACVVISLIMVLRRSKFRSASI
ncbi:MAG: hypothetical protein AAGD07_19850 [Planctomycetota bacterium]